MIDVSYNNLPEIVSATRDDVSAIKEDLAIIKAWVEKINGSETDRWFSVQDLCNYLPFHPVPNTVYRWVRERKIPYYRCEKPLAFLKSDIDNWMKSKRRKTDSELDTEAERFLDIQKSKLKK